MRLEKRYELLKKRYDKISAENMELREKIKTSETDRIYLKNQIQEIEKTKAEWETMLSQLKNKKAECDILHVCLWLELYSDGYSQWQCKDEVF